MDVDETNSNEQETEPTNLSKKVRLFSAKEFRSKLATSKKLSALQQFLSCCNSNHDYVIEYLQEGGSCLELLQLLEGGSEVPPSLILEIVNNVLLRIVSNYPQFHNSAYESCRYFLNSHLALVNKMLSLASTSKERKATLKLLTTIVTFSKKLAKEVLLHINFNHVNLEVLTKQSGEKESTRNAFIHFLVAFMVEGEFSVVSILLEKKGLVSSILHDLQYDPADTVCMILTTLKSHILEDRLVPKTVKMNTFSTPVVKDIVNLYNWKGPENFHPKKKIQTVTVNEYDKLRVNEAVHSFLMVLCTSHRFGVIFRDRQLGLGRKTHNSLMYTVLQSLERPWEHSYAGELVTNICGACPDLAKTMWANLKTYLEPRPTVRWKNAVTYAVALVKELEPARIDFCASDLSVHQLAQVIQFLIAPTPILKVIIPENHIFEQPVIKHHVLLLLAEFLKSIHIYLLAATNWTKVENRRTLKNLLNEHIIRNFPNAQSILKDWAKSDETLGPYSVVDHLEVIFELLDLYETVCPQLLESLSSVDVKSFLKEIEDLPNSKNLQVRAIKIFINFEPSAFEPNTDLFACALPLILGFYYETKDTNAKATLSLLFKNTNIFEGCAQEIDFWLNAIFDCTLDEEISKTIVEIVRVTYANIFEYLFKLPKLWGETEVNTEAKSFDILENLSGDSVENSGSLVKHHTLSPLLLGALEYLQNVEQSKSLRNYFNSVVIHLLHFQTTASFVSATISNEKYKGLISKHVCNYVQGWANSESPILIKTKAQLAQDFSLSFLSGDIDEFFTQHQEEIVARPGGLQNCLNQALFYFTNLSLEKLTDAHLQNCIKVTQFLITKLKFEELAVNIFSNPVLLQRFSPLHQGLTTSFLVEVIKQHQSLNSATLKPFRLKLVAALRKTLKKCSKKSVRLLEILEVFGIEHQECLDILSLWAELNPSNLENDFLSFYYNLLVYTLRTFLKQAHNLKPLHKEIVVAIAQMLTYLNKNLEQFDTSACASTFKNYLDIFPHNLVDLPVDIFASILTRTEFCKDSAILAGFLLSKRTDFLDTFVTNIPKVANKKGLMLSLLQAAVNIKAHDDILKQAYESFEPGILKALLKPKKAGPHFETYHDLLPLLIGKFMPEDVCQSYVEKVQKFDTSEPFHIQMLVSIFTKITLTEKHLNNCILTLVHATNFLFKKKDKSEVDQTKLQAIITTTNEFFDQIKKQTVEISFRTVCENEGFQLYCKFCLKFGLSGNVSLIKVLKTLVQFVNFEESEAQLLLEMAGSHSEFLELMLNEDCDCKRELLDLVLVLCQRWPALMQRNHVPVLLAAYRATVSPADRIILMLLQMYEKSANKTNFYDFKPFLWGTAAASHYSVRQDIQTALWRQPKMGDILDILREDRIINTISNYPLDFGLTATRTNSDPQKKIYDLAFFLPLFSSLLATENEVATYKFTKCGALSLTITALSSNDKDLRLAACHVLARYHYHLEASQGQKDKLLWLRYIEAICRGTAVFEDFKLNNFAAIFWARMGLVLTQPLKPLYVPLSQYLSARVVPNLKAVPELYTFLHSSDVNFKEMRMFILEILQDGLRTDDDFSIALCAMAFKLIMEMFSSCVADLDTKKSLLTVLERACRLNLGQKLLCSSYGLLSWLYELVSNTNTSEDVILSLVIQILFNIVESDLKFVDCNIVSLILTSIIDRGLVSILRKDALNNFLHVIIDVFSVDNKFLTEERLRTLISVTESKKCEYLLKYGCTYFETVTNCTETEDLIQLLVTKWINK